MTPHTTPCVYIPENTLSNSVPYVKLEIFKFPDVEEGVEPKRENKAAPEAWPCNSLSSNRWPKSLNRSLPL